MFTRYNKEEKRKLKESKKKAKKLAKENKKADIKKRKSGKEQKKKKGKQVIRVEEKEHVFPDVRLFRYMPIIFAVAVLLFTISFGTLGWQDHEYKVEQSKLAMPNNTQLPLFSGVSKGNLTLKNVMLSEDHKQMAASIGYDDDAHKQLSSFGNRYKLWVIAPEGYPVKDLSVKYGFFGTDGNAVLQVNSSRPLPDKAIVIIIIDAGHLVSQEDLQESSDLSTTDTDLNQSITAQLATGSVDASSDSSMSSTSKGKSSTDTIPKYFVRLNPYSAKHTNINWGDNEKEMVENLFVKHNLKHIKNQISENKLKLKRAKETKKEYEERLKINPQDQTALEGKQSMDDSIQSLQQTIQTQTVNFDRISKARFSKNVLGKQQTKHHSIITKDMGYFTNTGTKR